MSYAAIMKVIDNRVAKYAEFSNLKEAQGHVLAHIERWPEAFVTKSVSDNVMDWWVDGQTVTVVLPEPPRRKIAKSLVQQRLIDAGKIDAAHAALWSNKASFARWFAPDHPEVYADDPDALALLAAIGADPDVIMAPEAI